jgi:hypothetical protein
MIVATCLTGSPRLGRSTTTSGRCIPRRARRNRRRRGAVGKAIRMSLWCRNGPRTDGVFPCVFVDAGKFKPRFCQHVGDSADSELLIAFLKDYRQWHAGRAPHQLWPSLRLLASIRQTITESPMQRCRVHLQRTIIAGVFLERVEISATFVRTTFAERIIQHSRRRPDRVVAGREANLPRSVKVLPDEAGRLSGKRFRR